MKAYHNTAVLKFDDDTTGNAASGVPVTVRINSTQALASIFDVDDVAIGNPLTTDSNGNYSFKANDNIYDIIVSEGTANEVKLEKVEIAEIPIPSGLINDLSQAYEFATVAAYKAFTTAFPVGKVIHLLDRGAEFTVISGTGAATGFKIVGSDQVAQSVDLVVTDKTTLPAFGVVMDGSIESSSALIEALVYNIKPTEGLVWIDPATPIIIDTNKNKAFIGLAVDTLEFITTINDGSTLFECSGQWQHIKGFSIASKSGSPVDYVGMVFGDQTAVTSYVRSEIDTKTSDTLGTGLSLRGWNNDVKHFSNRSFRGFKGRELNACNITYRSENDTRALDWEEIYGTNVDVLLIEGIPAVGSATASRIDDARGLNINTIYTEGSGFTHTLLEFGQTEESRGVNINSGRITGSTLDFSPIIHFNKVDSATGNLDIETGSNPIAVKFDSTVNYNGMFAIGYWGDLVIEAKRNKLFTQDNSKSVMVHANYFGDTYLDHYLATFDQITLSNATYTEESNELRSGERGIRITADAGTHLASVKFERRGNTFGKMSDLVGKTIKAFAWVFVPDIAGFDDYTLRPSFRMVAQGAASEFPVAQVSLMAGQWNLIETEDLVIPVGWLGTGTDRIGFEFLLSDSSKTFTGAEYIIVDSIFVTETKCNIRDIMSGRYRESAKYFGLSTDGIEFSVVSEVYNVLSISYITLAAGEVFVKQVDPDPSRYGFYLSTGGVLGAGTVFEQLG